MNVKPEPEDTGYDQQLAGAAEYAGATVKQEKEDGERATQG